MKRRNGEKLVRISVIATIACLWLSIPARASEIYQFYTGVRQLGMGGAYAAVVNDETSLLTNPAGLGKLREWTFTMADPEVSAGARDLDAVNSGNLSKVNGFGGLQDVLNANKDKHWFTKGQAFPSIVGPNFGIGIHAKWQTNAEINSATNTYRLDYTNDYAVALGTCLRMFDGIIKLGLGGRAMNRTEIHKDLSPTQPDVSIETQGREGQGIAGDVGLILTAPVVALPTIAIVAHDVGTTSYNAVGMFHQTVIRPESTPTTIDAGFSLSPILSNRTRMQFTAEYHDVGTAGVDGDHMRRIHVGAELNAADFFFFRAGMNQRYWTSGFEVSTSDFQLQGAAYGEEIGTASAPREDRRFVGKISFRF